MTAAAAPQGRLALVFTDVQGSTSLWENHTEAMRAALDVHNAVMRRAIGAVGGYEVKTEGDAFMVAFAQAASAVQFCLEAQTALLSAEWPQAILASADAMQVLGPDGSLLFRGLRVRMGVHVGTPDCRTSPTTGRMDYFGPVVNRAARVASAGNGGQLIVSRDALAEVEPHLARLGAPIVRDLGKHWLKGLSTAEPLFQLAPAALAARPFGALNAAPVERFDQGAWAAWEAQLPDDGLDMLLGDAGSLSADGTLNRGRLPAAEAAPPPPRMELKLDLSAAPRRPARPREPPPAAPDETLRPRPRRGLAIALLAIVSVGAGAYWQYARPDLSIEAVSAAIGAQPDDEVERDPARGPELHIESEPPGANVLLGGAVVGKTPLVLPNTLSAGEIAIVITSKGYLPQKVTFRGGESKHIAVKLERAP